MVGFFSSFFPILFCIHLSVEEFSKCCTAQKGLLDILHFSVLGYNVRLTLLTIHIYEQTKLSPKSVLAAHIFDAKLSLKTNLATHI